MCKTITDARDLQTLENGSILPSSKAEEKNITKILTFNIELWEVSRAGLLDDAVDGGGRPTEEPVPYCWTAWTAPWGDAKSQKKWEPGNLVPIFFSRPKLGKLRKIRKIGED